MTSSTHENSDERYDFSQTLTVSRRSAHEVDLKVVRKDGTVAASGRIPIEGLLDLCHGEISAVLAGEMCLARDQRGGLALRVPLRRLALWLETGDLLDALAAC